VPPPRFARNSDAARAPSRERCERGAATDRMRAGGREMAWLHDVDLICAVVGGTLLVVQTILLAVGGAGDADGDPDVVDHADGPGDSSHDASFVKWLSLKTVVAFLTFFGLAGLAAHEAGTSPTATLLIALVAGLASVFFVGFLMAGLGRLQSKGNLDMQNAVGATAKVYLRVPAARSGAGKVTLEVQGRFVEAEAVTAGPELPIGAQVRVVGVSGLTVEVSPV
jgi:membrane protein implicated in regulation of membrane protease activity